MPCEVVAILEVKLVLPALLRGGCGNVAMLGRILENGVPELLIDEDAGALLRHSAGDSGFEAVVDHLFGGGDLCGLFRAQGALPAKHPCLEGAAMVKGQDIQGEII